MKAFAYACMVCSLLLLASAARQQITGHARVIAPTRYGWTHPTRVDRATDPQGFHDAMAYWWIVSALPGCLGIVGLRMIRRFDRLDPFSPDFQGSQALDELSDELDREQEKKAQG